MCEHVIFVCCVCVQLVFFFNHFWLLWVFIAAHKLSLVAVLRLPIVVASLVTELMLQVHSLYQLQHTGSLVVVHELQLLHGMWNLLRPKNEPISPALAGRFLFSVTPGGPEHVIYLVKIFCLFAAQQLLLINNMLL